MPPNGTMDVTGLVLLVMLLVGVSTVWVAERAKRWRAGRETRMLLRLQRAAERGVHAPTKLFKDYDEKWRCGKRGCNHLVGVSSNGTIIHKHPPGTRGWTTDGDER